MKDVYRERFEAAFEKELTPSRAEGMETILTYASQSCFGAQKDQLIAYILATAYWESGLTMQPVREGLKESDEDACAYVTKLYEDGVISTNYSAREENGCAYYGRGYVQLTWARNYKAMGAHLIGDESYFYDDPDKVMVPKTAAVILIRGMLDGIFAEASEPCRLEDFINQDGIDYINARRTVNRLNRAETIAEFARKFEYMLTGKRYV